MPRGRVQHSQHSRSHVGGVAMLSMGGLSAASVHEAEDRQVSAAITPEDLSVDALVARYGSRNAVPRVKSLPTMREMDVRHKKTLLDAGLSSLASDIDEVVFNRDLDGSMDLVADVRQSPTFRGAHGKTSKALGFEDLQARGGVLGGYSPPAPVGGARLPVQGDHHHHPQYGDHNEARNNLERMALHAQAPGEEDDVGGSSPNASPMRSSKRMLHDAGMCRQASVIDEVVFGHDMDGSTTLVTDVRQGRAYRGAQGRTSKQLGKVQLEASSSVLDISSKRHFEPLPASPPRPPQHAQRAGHSPPRMWQRGEVAQRPDPAATVHARRRARRQPPPKLGPRELPHPHQRLDHEPGEYQRKRQLAQTRTRLNIEGQLQAAEDCDGLPQRGGRARPSADAPPGILLAAKAPHQALRQAAVAASAVAALAEGGAVVVHVSPPAMRRRTDPGQQQVGGEYHWPPRHLANVDNISEGAARGQLQGIKAAEFRPARALAGQSSPELHRHETRDFRPTRYLADAGLTSNASMVDEVVFGHDTDGSIEQVTDVRQGRAYRGAQGRTSSQLGKAQQEASGSVLDIASKRHVPPPGVGAPPAKPSIHGKVPPWGRKG